MTHDDAFLRAIIEGPDDDDLRLVYADWLDERGDPRGEFIRVQVELARPSGDDGPPGARRRGELEARERELLREHAGEWAGSLRGRAGPADFSRGFVETIRARPEEFVAHADAWFRAAPIRR